MPAPHYRLPIALTASLALLLGGCTAAPTAQPDASMAPLPQPEQQQASAGPEGEMNTQTTIWTLLGIAKKPQQDPGPTTGAGVSPILWQATLDTLNFVETDAVDPMAGLAVTKWYSPKGKTDERFRITAFVKARALRSDAVVVTVERQTRSATGQWQDGPVAADVADNLENDILERARQIHIARIQAQR